MKILVYADNGVSSFSLKETLNTFKELFPQVATITYQQLMDNAWEKETNLFIIPGGRDIPYDRKLKGKGTAKIRKFVEEGGSFLGICAGAYFASKEVIFEKDTPLEVHETRDLKFFPGSAIGTLYLPKTFAYDSEKGAHASEISHGEESLYVYYNGGCTFYQAEMFPTVTILSRYQDSDNQPAIIHCKVGKGNALLSGVHFEVNPHHIKKEGRNMEMMQKLEASNKKRIALITSLLNYL